MATRAVIFPLILTKEQEKSLHQTLVSYGEALTHCLDIAWNMESLTKKKLHNKVYYFLRKTLGLKSQFACSSRDKATEIVKSIRALICRGKNVSKPSMKNCKIRLDANTLSFDKERTTASIATQDERIKIPLVWHKQAKKYASWDCNAGEIGLDRKGRWVLILIFKKKFEKPPRTNSVIGVDRGIKHPIVSSNNKFHGERQWNEIERKFRSHVSRLQSKGTKSAKRRLKKVSGRRRRFCINCDHVIVNGFLASLKPGDTVVLELLIDIREHCGAKGKACKKHRAKMGRWSFKRVESMLNDKAELNGIYIETVDARYTSQTCSRCNKVLKTNRKSQSLYSCSCGLKLNADLNAARNIAYKWCMANGYASGPIVNRPIVADPLKQRV